jgi:hypothetical protein
MLRYPDDMAAGRVLTISQGTAPVSIEGQLAVGDWPLALAHPRPPTPERRRRVLRHAPRREIAPRQGCRSWDIDHARCKWVVTLNSPEEQDLYGKTLEEALARWRLSKSPLSTPSPGSRVCCWACLPCRRSLTEEANTRRTPAAVTTAMAHLPSGGAGADLAAERCNARRTATVPVAIARIPKACARRDARAAAAFLAASAAGAAARELKGTACPLHTRARAAAAACLLLSRPAPMALALPALGARLRGGTSGRYGVRYGEAEQSGGGQTHGQAAGCAGADNPSDGIKAIRVHG